MGGGEKKANQKGKLTAAKPGAGKPTTDTKPTKTVSKKKPGATNKPANKKPANIVSKKKPGTAKNPTNTMPKKPVNTGKPPSKQKKEIAKVKNAGKQLP